MFICMQKINFISKLFLRYCEEIANLLFCELWECLIIPIKIITSICWKLSCLSACKKSTSLLTSFLKYCKEIENSLFWVLWYHRVFICQQKINFIPHIFLEINLQSYGNLFRVLWTYLVTHTENDTIKL